MAQDKKPENEQYQGTGKFVSAIGLGAITLSVMGGSTNIIKKIADIKPTRAVELTDNLASLAAFIVGAVGGWSWAGKGKDQFHQLKSERDTAQAQLGQAGTIIQSLTNEKTSLHHEVGEHRKRFAEGLKSHAEKGGHAAASAEDKAEQSAPAPAL
ncbi:MAG: hypothetical protein ACK5ZH_06420 [Alphaproteobacteria bacterium]